MRTKFILSLLAFLLSFNVLTAQDYRNNSSLTLENIMKGEEWTGTWPENVRWSVDGKQVLFTWNPDNKLLLSTYGWSRENHTIHRLTPSELKTIVPPHNRDFNADRSSVVYVKNGDLFLRDANGGKPALLLDFPSGISSPRFIPGHSHISFIYDQNLYLYDMESGNTRVLTDFRKGEKKAEKKTYAGEQEEWLHNEQMELFDILRLRKEKKDLEKERSDSASVREPKTIYTGSAKIYTISISRDEKHILFLSFTYSEKAKHVVMPEYVTESGFTETETIRAKVGYPYGTMKAGIYNPDTDSVYYADISHLPGIHDFPVFKETQTWETREDETRTVYLGSPVWSDDGNHVLINVQSTDNKDRWITLLDLKTGELASLNRQHDEAWIQGPGIGELTNHGTLGWYPDNRTIYFQSEESGYSHLYLLDTKTGRKKQLTSGDYEVYDPFLSRDKKTFYFTSNEENPEIRNFYSMPARGGRQTKLTTMTGNNEVSLSPDEKTMIIRYSYANKPWELYYKPNGASEKAEQITNSSTPAFKAYSWRVPEFIHFTASDGVSVPARLYRPAEKVSNNAAVIFVHGAGYLQNAHEWWSDYYHEYMFHNFLADNGYTVLDIDYRGSAGYGRDWRTAIYRHMGGRDLADNVDGAAYLVKSLGIDPGRIGIYGGSYGGFMTLMAQFTRPGTFKSGAALRSVTDWAHYNHGYTSNILNTPFTDSLAYQRSSPINFASGLQGHLLMCHGMIDDNVHFQDIVRLTQRLIELRKDNWELAVYPLESHKFKEWTSWLDEYKRVYKLFEETIRDKDPSAKNH